MVEISRWHVENIFFHFPTAAPDAPRSVKVSDLTKRSVKLSWDAPRNDGGSKIKGYLVERRTQYSSRWSKVNKTLVKDTELDVTDLLEGEEYEFRISAVNEAGSGTSSEPTPAITAKDPYGMSPFT